MDKVGAERPTWLDEAIEKVIAKGDAQAIAQVIANSPQVVEAIKRGLANKPKPGVMGPTYAQNVAREVREAVAAT
jgi:hypothetical protein